MRLLIATDAHLFVLPDNTYWCDSVETYEFWKRYLKVFDKIRIVARVKYIDAVDEQYRRVDGEGIEIWGVPFYQGPKQLLTKYVSINKRIKNCFADCDCALYRMPSQIANMVLRYMPKDMPYAGEIVYCQRDSLVGLRFGVTWILNSILSYKLKKFCYNANGVSYVTEKAIQTYYPSYAKINGSDKEHFESYYSSITLDDNAFTGARIFQGKNSWVLSISDAAMNSDRKGESVFLNVIKKLRDIGIEVRGIVIGDGSKKEEYQKLATELKIQEYVNFTGKVSSAEAVRKYLLESDIYLLPTQGEGLPRGILEAMALGMLVLSTPVGGIPEVLDEEFMFAPNDVDGFVKKIQELISDEEKLFNISERNFAKSLEYKNDELQRRRDIFYSKLKELVKNK